MSHQPPTVEASTPGVLMLNVHSMGLTDEQLDKLCRENPDQKESSPHMAPDFVVELRSPSDSWPLLQEKMLDYMRNGVRLGWLIDPEQKCVYVYRHNQPLEKLDNPPTLAGDPILPGFTFTVQEIW